MTLNLGLILGLVLGLVCVIASSHAVATRRPLSRNIRFYDGIRRIIRYWQIRRKLVYEFACAAGFVVIRVRRVVAHVHLLLDLLLPVEAVPRDVGDFRIGLLREGGVVVRELRVVASELGVIASKLRVELGVELEGFVVQNGNCFLFKVSVMPTKIRRESEKEKKGKKEERRKK